MTPDDIKPAVHGQSDKFSWRLYKRVKREGFQRVYVGSWNMLTGYEAPDLDALKRDPRAHYGKLMLGEMYRDESFIGARLSNILCTDRVRINMSYCMADHHVPEWIDVTDWFWPEYLRIGRCLFHRHAHAWDMLEDDYRVCMYCAKVEKRTIQVIEKEVWA